MRSAMSILLVFLLAGAAHGDSILLASEAEAAAAKPWECCDHYVMSRLRIFPPLHRCEDADVYVCNDWYSTAEPGPFCTPWPWGDCCDAAVCTRAYIPTCACADEVESCAAACKDCEVVDSSEPPRYVCKDQFKGQPGLRCTPDDDDTTDYSNSV
uniref:Bowman-Birk serine protease inhibitors family domain-containing protein n=1 Tax=Oryza brachyantha TaxID=4533 RepID=J3KUP9_ORYBR